MNSKEILNKYINFYKERGHRLIPNVSLVPENDPTLLFVNSGVFLLVPYVFGETHPLGKRLMNVQRCVRFEDLENVGISNRHTIAFHMIGNWSLGDYFKETQLPWKYEFFIEVLGLDVNKIYGTVFAGDSNAPKDRESVELLKNIFAKYGIDAKEGERIFAYGKDSNWWKRGDAVGEPGGPSSEIFYYIGSDGDGNGLDPAENEDLFIEIGNSVFMRYKKTENGWEELAQKNVDFGGGLERIALAVQKKQDIFETDNFWPIIQKIEEISGKQYGYDEVTTKAMRILADHMRTATFMAMDDVMPSNKDRGYLMRRILRRMVRAGKTLNLEQGISTTLLPVVAETFEWLYPQIIQKQEKIQQVFEEEENKFRKTLNKGSKEAEKILNSFKGSEADLGKHAFNLYQSMGYPVEIFIEDIKDYGLEVELDEIEEEYENLISEHKNQSREGAEQKFKGGLADTSEQTIKYHTTTHLLHWALRQTLGSQVQQQGSNITGERLRFDFSWSEQLSTSQIKKVEEFVNEKIGEALPVQCVVLPREEAEKTGALSFFKEKYADLVKVYFIGETIENAVSKEFCGGPHVENTGELKPIEIYKQKKLGEDVIRVYARFR